MLLQVTMSQRQRRFFLLPMVLSACFFTGPGKLAFAGTEDGAGPATPQWRPALHYTPLAHWMNDPNGPILLDGIWHLFYQYNPNGMIWGHSSWGHATSRDLLHWQEEGVAIPFSAGRDIFSGSVILDKSNRSGLGQTGVAPLIALYTTVFSDDPLHPEGTQAQSLSYSLDHGQSWQSSAHNPVLTLNPDSKQFRDPSVVWYAPGKYWVMTTVVADAQVVKLYRSSDLIHWDFLSDFQPSGYRKPGMLWEMPALIPLPLYGNPDTLRWVMIVSVNPWSIAGGSGVEYFTGRFDGIHFVSDPLPRNGADPAAYHWLDHGADNYAAIRFANTGDRPPQLISWMNNWDYADRLPTTPWRGQMTLPVSLSLKTQQGATELLQTPAPEYEIFVSRHASRVWPDRKMAANTQWRLPLRTGVADIRFTLRSDGAGRAGVVLHQSRDRREGTTVIYDFATHRLTLDRSHAGQRDFSDRFSPVHIAALPLQNRAVTLHLVMDRSSVEVFANEGALRMTDLVFPDRNSTFLSLFTEGAPASIDGLRVVRLDL